MEGIGIITKTCKNTVAFAPGVGNQYIPPSGPPQQPPSSQRQSAAGGGGGGGGNHNSNSEHHVGPVYEDPESELAAIRLQIEQLKEIEQTLDACSTSLWMGISGIVEHPINKMRLYITDADVASLPVIQPGDQVVAILAPQGTSLEIPDTTSNPLEKNKNNQLEGGIDGGNNNTLNKEPQQQQQRTVIVRSQRDPVEIWKIHGESETHHHNHSNHQVDVGGLEPSSPMVLRPDGAGATPVMVGTGVNPINSHHGPLGTTPPGVYSNLFHQQGSPEAKMVWTGAPLGGISPGGPFWPGSATADGVLAGNSGRVIGGSGGIARGIHSGDSGGFQLPIKPLAAPSAVSAPAVGAAEIPPLPVSSLELITNDPLDILERKERDAVAAAIVLRAAAAAGGGASGSPSGGGGAATRPNSGASPGKKSPRLSPGALRPPASPNALLKLPDGAAIDAEAW